MQLVFQFVIEHQIEMETQALGIPCSEFSRGMIADIYMNYITKNEYKTVRNLILNLFEGII